VNRRGVTMSWAQTTAVCGACSAAVPAGSSSCPQCDQTTGPFTTRVVNAQLHTNPAGEAWLHGPRGSRRQLNAEQARWLERGTLR
jgi:hypothetical protein